MLRARPHLAIGALCGLAAAPALAATLPGLTGGIMAWDIGCAVYLGLNLLMASREHLARMATDAARQQEGQSTILWLTMGAIAASFAAITEEFSALKQHPHSAAALRVALLAVTLLLSWLMTHTVFALRYAHEYYAAGPDRGPRRGLDFPGEQAPDYWDFFYFALVLGMTFQVSDVAINARRLRRLATLHGLLGFLFNTVILALSVNIGASFL